MMASTLRLSRTFQASHQPARRADAWAAVQARANPIAPTEAILAAAARGGMFILVDDPDRENEGDLVILADYATPQAINFMAVHGRGLVCLAMEGAVASRLGLEMAPRRNVDAFHTPFTNSIDALDGISTGISAADRAHTIRRAMDTASGPADFVSPGHIFPLVARPGGVLERNGHTEASVDIARLAGATPAAVICEILNDDGTMARLPDLTAFARKHQMLIGTIDELIAYQTHSFSTPCASRYA